MATTTNCCSLLKKELNPCQEYFNPVDSTGAHLDIEESFGPSSWFAILAKLVLGGYAVGTWISMFVAADERGFFFAYLTVWTLSLQIIYHIFSLWLSLVPPPGINTRVKITWYLFNMVSHTSILVALLWWGTVFDGDISFNLVSPHAATAVVLLIEGFVINRIPIRVFHWFGSVLPMNIAYPVWTVLHAVFDVGNPNESGDSGDPDTNDDVLYPSVDWKDDVVGTLVLILVVALVVGPLVQLFLFALSLYSPTCRVSRRYLDDVDDYKESEQPDPEKMDELYASSSNVYASPF